MNCRHVVNNALRNLPNHAFKAIKESLGNPDPWHICPMKMMTENPPWWQPCKHTKVRSCTKTSRVRFMMFGCLLQMLWIAGKLLRSFGVDLSTGWVSNFWPDEPTSTNCSLRPWRQERKASHIALLEYGTEWHIGTSMVWWSMVSSGQEWVGCGLCSDPGQSHWPTRLRFGTWPRWTWALLYTITSSSSNICSIGQWRHSRASTWTHVAQRRRILRGHHQPRCWKGKSTMLENAVYAADRAHPLLPLGRLATLLDTKSVWKKGQAFIQCCDKGAWKTMTQFEFRNNMAHANHMQFEVLRRALWAEQAKPNIVFDWTFWERAAQDSKTIC